MEKKARKSLLGEHGGLNGIRGMNQYRYRMSNNKDFKSIDHWKDTSHRSEKGMVGPLVGALGGRGGGGREVRGEKPEAGLMYCIRKKFFTTFLHHS
jgi:hypothetical protein